MIPIPELGIEVEDVSDFNDEAGEILTGFCEGLQSEGGTRLVTEDDNVGDYTGKWLWTYKSMDLIQSEISRLYTIGCKYFNEDDLDISSHMYKEVE